MSSSGNILDNAEVEFLLDGSGAGESPEVKEEAEAQEQAVTMRGNLDQINLSDIFQTLAMTKMEGVLRVHNPLEQRHVYCSDGFVRILTPPRVIQRRIGQRLVQAGMITTDQLRSALMRQRKDKNPLGKILIDDGIITEEQIDEVASVQVAEDLFGLFTWSHGTFEFYRGAVTDQGLRERFETCPEFEVSSLLLEVARRSDEWESILGVIGNLDELPVTTSKDAPREFNDIEYALFRGADGRTTYRQLAEQTTQGLFEVSRVARDLVNEGLLQNISEEQMVATADSLAEEGNPKQAVMVLQTLRDRPTDLSLEVVRGVAAVLERAGERKLAGLTLLEVAQLQSDPELALSMARDACAFAPHDPATLGFLRTTLLKHSAPEAPEIEEVTCQLIDAMLSEDQVEEALKVIGEARELGRCGPAILVREARVRQKNRDSAGAVAVFEEVADLYRALGEPDRVRDAYESILRIDRNRKDIQKLLHKMQQTTARRIVRYATMVIAVGLLGSMGIVLWQQHRFETSVREAGEEISELIRAGERLQARDRLVHWAEVLGECEEADDLRRQVDFAEAAELQRRTRAARQLLNARLVTAAEMLDKGQLRAALVVYAELRGNEDHRSEVDEVIATRLKAVITDVEETAKTMVTRLPAEPTRMMDRRELTRRLADIKSLCRPTLYVLVDDIAALHDAGELPDFINEAQRAALDDVLLRVRDVYARAKNLEEAYVAALELSETQRRYDPMFKEALQREAKHDFAGALELFRELQKADVNDPEVRALFRDHITRNATICKLMAKLDEATRAGEYAVAFQQLRALQLAFPDVPFDELVRLPLHIESYPSGARVHCNGAEVGTTPCAVSFVPADPNRFLIALDGFRSREVTLDDDHAGRLSLRLVYEPRHALEHPNAVDAPPLTGDDRRMFLVDRGGNVTSMTPGVEPPHWSYKTGDLSGLLSRPFRHRENIVFASLDGRLRALDAGTGAVVWSMPNLPTEVEPVQFGKFLVLATTDDRICVVDLERQTEESIELHAGGRVRLLRAGNRLIIVTPDAIAARAVPSLKRLWRQPGANLTDLHAAASDTAVVAIADHGVLLCLDPKDGAERWRQIEDGAAIGPPILDGDAVLVASRRQLVRLDLADGSGRRAVPNEGADSQPGLALIGNRVVIPTADGEVQVLDAKTCRRLYSLEGSSRSVRVLPWQRGALVALPDRRLHFYSELQ